MRDLEELVDGRALGLEVALEVREALARLGLEERVGDVGVGDLARELGHRGVAHRAPRLAALVRC